MPDKNLTLLLDSSASPLLAAAAKDGRVFSARRKGIKQEKLLFPLLAGLLQKAGAQLQDTQRIFIVRGPGRFTGIRIALTFASMMHYLGGCEVRGATLFEVLRFQAEHTRAFMQWKKTHPAGVLAVVLNAFREEYFLQIFSRDNPAPLWLSREALLAHLAACTLPLFLTGSAKDGAPLGTLTGERYALAPAAASRVQPAALARMAQDARWEQNALEPLYLKPARFELETPR